MWCHVDHFVLFFQLEIITGAMKLEDQFEWDLENDSVTPEEFSEVYAQDLGLGGEFKYVFHSALFVAIFGIYHLPLPFFVGLRSLIAFENKFKCSRSRCSSSGILLMARRFKMTSSGKPSFLTSRLGQGLWIKFRCIRHFSTR